MRRSITGRYLALSACLALALTPKLAHAQAKAQGVTFDTVDGVELKGSFYPGGQGNKSPCVILLH